jgi:hypothetical protein
MQLKNLKSKICNSCVLQSRLPFLSQRYFTSWLTVFAPGGSVIFWRVLFVAGWDKIQSKFFPLTFMKA